MRCCASRVKGRGGEGDAGMCRPLRLLSPCPVRCTTNRETDAAARPHAREARHARQCTPLRPPEPPASAPPRPRSNLVPLRILTCTCLRPPTAAQFKSVTWLVGHHSGCGRGTVGERCLA
eukprot:363087-Chlamydomonas_euryale.AAC.3